MCTTRLSPEVLATAEIVGAHADEPKAEPTTKIVKRTSKGVKTK